MSAHQRIQHRNITLRLQDQHTPAQVTIHQSLIVHLHITLREIIQRLHITLLIQAQVITRHQKAQHTRAQVTIRPIQRQITQRLPTILLVTIHLGVHTHLLTILQEAVILPQPQITQHRQQHMSHLTIHQAQVQQAIRIQHLLQQVMALLFIVPQVPILRPRLIRTQPLALVMLLLSELTHQGHTTRQGVPTILTHHQQVRILILPQDIIIPPQDQAIRLRHTFTHHQVVVVIPTQHLAVFMVRPLQVTPTQPQLLIIIHHQVEHTHKQLILIHKQLIIHKELILIHKQLIHTHKHPIHTQNLHTLTRNQLTLGMPRHQKAV